MKSFLYAGIEIGGTKLQMVVGNSDGLIIDKRRFNVDKSSGADGIRRTIEAHLPELIRHKEVRKIAVGFGGPVDWRNGKICRSHQIEGWSDFDISRWLKSITGIDVVVENDANTGALGEAICGNGRGFNPVFFVTLGSGVGGGLVVDGGIYHGDLPGECEIGHVRLDKSGTIVESRCSGWAVDRKIRNAINSGADTLLKNLVGDSSGGEARFLKPAIEENDKVAIQILNEVADDLAYTFSHVTHLLHPQVIVLGGGLSNLGSVLSDEISNRLPNYVMEAFKPTPSIKIAGLGEDTIPVGALIPASRNS